MKIKVRENLAGEITYGKTDTGASKKEAFGFRETDPVFPLPFYDTVSRRVVPNDFRTKPEKFFAVGS